MTNQRGSVLPAVAFLFGAAVVVLIFGYMLWPKDSDVNITGIDVSKVVKNTNANSNANTNANVNAATNVNANTNVNTATDATKDWKTYTSESLGFTALYPDPWVVSTCEDTYVAFDTKEHRCETEYTSGFNVKTLSPDDVDTQAESTKKEWTNVRDERLTIDGQPARSISGNGSVFGDSGWYQAVVYVTIGNKALSFHYLEKLGTNPPNLANFNNFTSHLKLISPTAGWKTFTNTAYSYIFKYPNDIDSDVYGNEYGKDASVASSVGVPGYLVKKVRQSALFSVEVANPRYSNPNDPVLKFSLKDFATKVWEGNKNDTNPNVPNKKVGDLATTTVAGQTAYSFTVTGSFKDYFGDGGYALNEEHTYYIVEFGGKKYLLWYPSAQLISKTILSTFTK